MEQTPILNRRFARNPSMLSREIADEFILVPIQQKAGEVASIYTLNDVGGFIWELLDGDKRVSEVRDAVVQEFQVGPEEAQADLVELLEQLEAIDAVTAV